MLSQFRSQQPAAFALFILFFILLKLPFFWLYADAQVPQIDMGWWQAGFFLPERPFLSVLLAQACVLLQAVWFNYLFHQADYHESNTLLPAVYFSGVTALLPEFNVFSHYHLLVFVCLLLFRELLRINSLESAKAESFNAGLIAGALILLMPGMILFLPFLFVILYVLKVFRFQEFVLLAAGVITPVYMAYSIAWLADQPWPLSVYYDPLFYVLLPGTIQGIDLAALILLGAYLLFSFISLRGILFSVGFRRRKNVNMTVWLFLGMLAVVLGNARLVLPVLMSMWLPVSVFLTLLILRARRKRIAEILHTVFVLTIFIINILRLIR